MKALGKNIFGLPNHVIYYYYYHIDKKNLRKESLLRLYICDYEIHLSTAHLGEFIRDTFICRTRCIQIGQFSQYR